MLCWAAALEAQEGWQVLRVWGSRKPRGNTAGWGAQEAAPMKGPPKTPVLRLTGLARIQRGGLSQHPVHSRCSLHVGRYDLKAKGLQPGSVSSGQAGDAAGGAPTSPRGSWGCWWNPAASPQGRHLKPKKGAGFGPGHGCTQQRREPHGSCLGNEQHQREETGGVDGSEAAGP